MKIPQWFTPENQTAQIGRHHWSVSRLHHLVKGMPVIELPIDGINVWHNYEKLTMRKFVMHMKAVMDADLKYPIILDEDGEIMDGRHRLMKAMYLGKKTIKAVRFDENPSPCKVDD
jgi:hypothetical protein